MHAVTLKRGHIVTPHFAHQPGSNCSYAGIGESEEHRSAKFEIYQALLTAPGVTNVQMERNLQEVRPDVSCIYKDTLIAIEVQISNLSPDDIERRTRAYASKNIAVLWTPPQSLEVFEERYAPRHWERYIHTLYYKTVYYWFEGLNIHPIRYIDHWLEASRYTSARRSKRFVEIVQGKPLSILNMAAGWRGEWTGPQHHFPRARLWMPKSSPFAN
jgi:competence protein CoiA